MADMAQAAQAAQAAQVRLTLQAQPGALGHLNAPEHGGVSGIWWHLVGLPYETLWQWLPQEDFLTHPKTSKNDLGIVHRNIMKYQCEHATLAFQNGLLCQRNRMEEVSET